VPDIYIANIGDETKLFVTALTDKLRKAGVKCERDLLARSLKAQMKYADKCGARYSIVIGGDEAEKKSAILKNMAEKEQTEVSLDDLSQLINILKEEK
jgi:histidyl-tRNA synthetase